MNQEEAPEFTKQRDAEVEKSRMEKREEIFTKDRGGCLQKDDKTVV